MLYSIDAIMRLVEVRLIRKQCYAYHVTEFVQHCRQCTLRIFPDGLVTLDVVQYVGDNKSDIYHIWTKKVSYVKNLRLHEQPVRPYPATWELV